jgi:anti-sigma B factor antagonist
MTNEHIASFRASAHEAGSAVVIVAEGELDLVGAPRLLDAMPAEGTTRVVLDLGGVQFMDSSGLRSLLEARQSCIEAGRPFAIARPSVAVSRVLELVDLSSEFEVVERPETSGDAAS